MKQNIFKILFFFLFLSQTVIAQTDSLKNTDTLYNPIFLRTGAQIDYGLNDASELFLKISEADNNDLLYTGLFIGGLAASFTLDDEIRNINLHNQNASTKTITDLGEKYGNGLYAGALSIGLFITGLLIDNEKMTTTGRILFEALLVAGTTAQIIKIVSGRSRPFNNEGSEAFNFFKFDNPHNSFPSGHTVVAFATSSVLASSIKNIYASIGLYAIAGLTSYQRIYSDNHWLSDTILAAGLGTVVGNLLVMINDERNDKTQNNQINFNFAPAVFPTGAGINFTLNF